MSCNIAKPKTHGRSTGRLVKLACMYIASCWLAGCYSTSSFKSDSAAIHEYSLFSAYQYTIMFDRLDVEQSTAVEYDFSNPPSGDFVDVLIFENKDDLDLLVAHTAVAAITITDDSGDVVYEFAGPLTASSAVSKPADGSAGHQWNFVGFGALNPPPDWQFDRTRVSTGPSVSPFHLKGDGYRIELRIDIEGRLPREVGIHLALRALGAGSV